MSVIVNDIHSKLNRAEVKAIIASSMEAHREIAAALLKGDPKRTAAAVAAHLQDVEHRMVERLR